MSNEEWYYAEDGEQLGPTSSDEIRRLATAGKIEPDDLVWREGMDDWLPAGEIPGLLVAKKKPKPAVVKPKAEWYFAEDGEQLGPISEADLRKKVEQKKVQADDLIWREGMEDWLPAAQVTALKLFPKKPKPARKSSPTAENRAPAEPAARSKPKPAKKQADPAPPPEPEVETPAIDLEPNPQPRKKSAPPAQEIEPPAEPEPEQPFADEDPWEESEEYLLQKEEELFGDSPASAAARRSRPSASWPEAPPTKEIIREVIKEKSVPLSPDAQLSNGALLLQILCWAICALAVICGAGYCIMNLNFASESKLMIAIYGTAAIFVFSHSVQRCLELSSQTKRRR